MSTSIPAQNPAGLLSSGYVSYSGRNNNQEQIALIRQFNKLIGFCVALIAVSVRV